MEADKTVSAQLEVSDLTTAFQTQVVPMPVCKYEILEGGPSGQPIQFATIGQQVYHKWTCDSETTDTFCAVVHSCTVDDGNGDTIQILNEEGCALDKFLLNNLEYPTDLMAGQEAHVYKYADRSQLFYQCQISITIKEPHGECARPQCAEPTGFGAQKLGGAGGGQATGAAQQPAARNGTAPHPPVAGRAPAQLRLLRKRAADFDNTMDVRTELSTLDISEHDSILPNSLRRLQAPARLQAMDNGMCVSTVGLTFMTIVGTGAVFVMAAAAFCLLRKPSKY